MTQVKSIPVIGNSDATFNIESGVTLKTQDQFN